MTRKLKPQKVDTVVVGNARVSVDIMLDRNQLDFFAALGLDEVRAKSAEECKRKAIDLANKWQPTNWRQVIRMVVERDESEYWSYSMTQCTAGVRLRFYRLEVAKKLNGEDVCRLHQLDHEDKLASRGTRRGRARTEEFRTKGMDIEYLGDLDEDEREIPYSDEAWAALLAVQAGIESATTQLEDLFRGQNPLQRLLQHAPLQLLPTKKDKS